MLRVLRKHATLVIRQQMRVAAERAVRGFGSAVRGFGSAAFRRKLAAQEARKAAARQSPTPVSPPD